MNFETGFVDGQNVPGVSGLFPEGLVVTNTNDGVAQVRSGAGVVGGSSPVGTFALTSGEIGFFRLDFSLAPVP